MATQDEDAISVFCGRCTADIVGVQHYRGTISPGEIGTVRRQKNNPYDSNAIAIYSPHSGIQIGHIKREVAAVLARLMDGGSLHLEPRVTALGTYTIQCDLDFYANMPDVAAVHNAIRALPAYLRYPWLNFEPDAGPESAPTMADRIRVPHPGSAPRPQAASVYSGGGGASSGAAGVDRRPSTSGASPSMETLLASGATALFSDAIPYDLQPEAAQPALLSTLLLPHQLKGLAWMLLRES